MSQTVDSQNLEYALSKRNEQFPHGFRETNSYGEAIELVDGLDEDDEGASVLDRGTETSGRWNAYTNAIVDAVFDEFGHGFASRVERKLNESNYDDALTEIQMLQEVYDDKIEGWQKDREAGIKRRELDENSVLSDQRFDRIMEMKQEGAI